MEVYYLEQEVSNAAKQRLYSGGRSLHDNTTPVVIVRRFISVLGVKDRVGLLSLTFRDAARVQAGQICKIIKSTPGQFHTWVIEEGVQPGLHIEHKTSRVKQYFKQNRAMRTETTINDPKDFGVNQDFAQLAYLQQIGRTINRRLLDVHRVSHNCHLSQQNVERVVLPTFTAEGQRAPGPRFGQPRVMALLAALTAFVPATQGFTHRTLRPLVADLMAVDPP